MTKSIHRDIKPVNILMDQKGRALLADLGESRIFETTIKAFKINSDATLVGTLGWMAPEIYKSLENNKERAASNHKTLDSFSVGLVLLNVIDKHNFKKDFKEFSRDEKKLNDYISNLEKNYAQGQDESYRKFFDLIKRMVLFDYNKRASILYLHSYFLLVRKSEFNELIVIIFRKIKKGRLILQSRIAL